MRRKTKVIVLAAMLAALLCTPSVLAFNITDMLRMGNTAVIVEKFAQPLNDFISATLRGRNLSEPAVVKVVPVINAASGLSQGAVQVSGVAAQVEKTEAVMELTDTYNGGQFRVKMLVPADSRNISAFQRVPGVGVTALIEVKSQ